MKARVFFPVFSFFAFFVFFVLCPEPAAAKVAVENGSPNGSAHHQFFFECFKLEFRALGGEAIGGEKISFALVVAEETAAIPPKEAVYLDGQIEPLREMLSEKIMRHPRAFLFPLNLWAREWAQQACRDLRQRAQKAASNFQ